MNAHNLKETEKLYECIINAHNVNASWNQLEN